MANIRLKTITVEPDQSPLTIEKGSVEITDTIFSSSPISGAVVVRGGIGIACSHEASSATAGGSLSVGGGCSVLRSLFIGNDLVLENSSSQLRVAGLTEDRLHLGTVAEKAFYVSTDGLHRQFEITDVVSVRSTHQSLHGSLGALSVSGGLSVATTEDAASSTSGRCLTVSGGAGVAKRLFVGVGIVSPAVNTIGSLLTDTSGNVGIGSIHPISPSQFQISASNKNEPKISLYAEDEYDHTGIGLTQQQLNYHVASTEDSHVFQSTGVNGNGLEILRMRGDGHVGIGTSSPAFTLDVDGQLRASGHATMESDANTLGNLYTTGGNVGIGTSSPLAAMDVRGTLRVVGESSLQNVKLNESLYLARNTNTDVNTIETSLDLAFTSASAESSFMTLATTGQLGIGTTSPLCTVDVRGTMRVDNNSSFLGQTNTLGNVYTTGGNVGVGSSSPSARLHVSHTASNVVALQATSIGNLSFNIANDNVANVVWQQVAGVARLDIESAHEAQLVKAMSFVGDKVGVLNTNPSHTLDVLGNLYVSSFVTLAHNSNTVGALVTTGGNVGIRTNVPDYTLDINGSLRASGSVAFSGTRPSANASSGSIVLFGGLSIDNSADATSVTSGGSITLAGGIGIAKRMYVGGVTRFTNTTPSTSYSVGAVMVQGGLTVQGNQNAYNVGNGGALTVVGGASVGGDLWVGGQINGSGSSSSTFAYLTLTATDEAVNLTTGTLVTFGGITIQCTTNATSVENGGALLVNGGGSFYSDVYVGGELTVQSCTNYKSWLTSLINFYDEFDVKRMSVDFGTNGLAITRYDGLGDFVEKTFELSHDGVILLANTAPSVSATEGALVVGGGLSIGSPQEAVDFKNGGGVTIAGGQSIAKNLLVGEGVKIHSTAQSYDVSSGALTVTGGVGVGGNLNVLGNTVIAGNLTVSGETTTVVSSNTAITDNVLLLNAGPTGTKDSGFIVERFQTDNDAGAGDVVNDARYTMDTLGSQASMSSTQIKLSSASSSEDGFYSGWWIKVASGFGFDQVRKIISYAGATRVATVSSPWTTQNPAFGDKVYLYKMSYVGLVYNELFDRFEFGATVEDPGQQHVAFSDAVPLQAYGLTCVSTQPSTSATSGAFFSSGGVTITNSAESMSPTSGGTLTTYGGAGIAKSLHVGGSLFVNGVDMTPNDQDVIVPKSFNGANNQSSLANIADLAFSSSVWGFDVFLAARVEASSNLYANYHIRGINKGNSWEIVKSYVGHDTGIEFAITSAGQVQYTTPAYNGFVSLVFKWKGFVNS